MRTGRRLARGLEDVSHLFLSRVSAPTVPRTAAQDQPDADARPLPTIPTAAGAPARTRNEAQDEDGLRPSRLLLQAPRTASGAVACAGRGERLVSLICKSVGALEEGLRVIDADLRLDVGGPVDLVAIDRQDRIVIIDVEAITNDALLLRGICHLDWFVRNVPVVTRMYSACKVDFTSEPRVFLLAPGFSPTVLAVARRVAPLRVVCIAFDLAPLLAKTGTLFTKARS